MPEPLPACQHCGACCAAFRVSFYWSETDAHPDGRVPTALTTAVGPHHAAMRGTEHTPVRCVALEGTLGNAVRCTIYTERSSTCREFEAGSANCIKARALLGLE